MSASWSSFLFLLPMLALAPAGVAQSSQTPLVPDQPPYTLQLNSRLVLTDVTVTDAKGNPVHGLTGRDFQVFDNGKPQNIASFDEHREQRTPPGAFDQPSTNVFSNNLDANPPPVVNLLLIDTTTIRLPDQMYLYEQLTRFVRALPPGEPVAVFLRSGSVTLPLQSFTTNKQLLMTAIREAIPHFRVPGYWYRSGYETLWQMATYLSQMPGRKNILWFSGGSNVFLTADPMMTQMPMRDVYDMLEKLRIALYPIDARGLRVDTPGYRGAQHLQMAQDAEATGGYAYYNTNGLAQAAQRVLNTDGDYYTLTYAPDDLHDDSKWHKVTVKIADGNRSYRLSYRRGYYDDGQNDAALERSLKAHRHKDADAGQAPDPRSQPILFQAVVKPAEAGLPADIPAKPLKRGETAFRIHYTLPARDIAPASVTGKMGTDQIGAAILALDRNGEPITRIAEKATLVIDEAKLAAQPNGVLTFDQQINLPRGEDYLDISLWDMSTGRGGMLTVPLAVSKHRGK